VPEPVPDYQGALGWFAAEHAVLLAVVNNAAVQGFDTHTWQLAWSMWTFFERRGLWRDQVTTGRLAVAAAGSMADAAARAFTHRHLAAAYIGLGRYAEAETQLRNALRIFDETDRLGRAHTHFAFAVLSGRIGRNAEALDHARKAHDLYRSVGHRRGEALALNVVGWHQAHLGHAAHALTHCRQALMLLQEVGDIDGQAETWDSLGYAHHRLGEHADAIECYENSLTLYHNLGDRYHEALILAHLGDVHLDAGRTRPAAHAFERALGILEDLDHPDRDRIRAKIDALGSPAGVSKS
jgi:tetratricopeptide (TPR) repeat protein